MAGARMRSGSGRRAVGLVLLAGLVAGCGPNIPAADLPPLKSAAPMKLPQVLQQFDAALARVEKHPARAAANGELGMIYRAYLEYEAAEAAFRRARLLAPSDSAWTYYHGEVLERLGRLDESLAATERLLEMEPGDLPARVRLLNLLVELGQYDRAGEQVGSLLRDAPDHVGLFMTQAKLLERSGQIPAALAALRKALELGGHMNQAHYRSSILYRRLGNDEEANRHMALFQIHSAMRYGGDDPWLARLYELNLSDRPTVRAALAAKARGDDERALQFLELGIERNPENHDRRAQLITGYAAAGEFDKAEAHYREGTALDPNHVELHYAFGRLRTAQGSLGDAIAAFEKATQLAPQHVRARAWFGHMLELRGRSAAAGMQLKKAINLDPRDATARRYYAGWLLKHADKQVAVAELRAMAGIATADQASTMRSLSSALVRADDPAAALDVLDRAIELAQWQENGKLASSLRNDRWQLQNSLLGGTGGG